MLAIDGELDEHVTSRRRPASAAAWLFPHLAPHEPPGRDASAQRAYLKDLAASLVEAAAERRDADLDHPTLPAAYVFFAQFVANELSARRPPMTGAGAGARAVFFDLAGVYGSGPSQHYLYDRASADGRLLVAPSRGPGTGPDLPRNGQGRALLGEPRNDCGLVLGQLHLAFLLFHNAVLDRVRDRTGLRGGEAFEEARRLVRWHFQWLVLHDFLPRLVGRAVVDRLLSGVNEGSGPGLVHYGTRPRPVVPPEFSLGAYLARLSLHRSGYELGGDRRVCSRRCVWDVAGSADLRPACPRSESGSLAWARFVEIDGSRPQACRRLNTHLTSWLHYGATAGRAGPAGRSPEEGSVIRRALVEAWRAGLPSGQDVARALGLRPVRPGHDPLLVYVLTEAEDPPNDGVRLVGVGAQIVAETLVGAVATDRDSFLRREPSWRPTLSSAGRPFDLAEMLRVAGVPFTAPDGPTYARVAPFSEATALRRPAERP